ncbi:MAG: outer membrane protein OmpA [Myxococcales bacterium]|nr:outer membrane protein OmpA [Myxococcales bacterium]
MPSSSRRRAVGLAFVVMAMAANASSADAQQQAKGFAVERLYPSAPTGGWFVMDDLDIEGALGGAMALTLGYAHNPLRVPNGSQPLAVVSDEAIADFAFALTYSRWRFYLNLDVPLVITGHSGTIGDHAFTSPSVDLASTPDRLLDPRIGVDVRIFGAAKARFRLGAGAQLFVPNGDRADYYTDDTFRGMVRLLFAGDVGLFSYAGQLGVHIRPLDDSATPGSPKGSELLFGVAAGVRLPVAARRSLAVVVGPELFLATAFRSFFGTNGTALECLLSGRLEGTRDDRLQWRLKLGVGAGLTERFSVPEIRVIAGIEVFNHNRRPSLTSTR